MKVYQLIKELEKMNPQSEVYLLSDPEGNGYWKLSSIDDNYVIEDGEICDTTWTAEQACQDPDEWELIKGLPRIVLLWP